MSNNVGQGDIDYNPHYFYAAMNRNKELLIKSKPHRVAFSKQFDYIYTDTGQLYNDDTHLNAGTYAILAMRRWEPISLLISINCTMSLKSKSKRSDRWRANEYVKINVFNLRRPDEVLMEAKASTDFQELIFDSEVDNSRRYYNTSFSFNLASVVRIELPRYELMAVEMSVVNAADWRRVVAFEMSIADMTLGSFDPAKGVLWKT